MCPTPPGRPCGSTELEVCYPGRMLPALSGVTLRRRAGRGRGHRRAQRMREVDPPQRPARPGPAVAARSAWVRRTWPTSTPTPGGPELAWVPQRPHLFARSIADNVRLGRPDATDDEVRAAIDDAGLDEVVARLPDGPGPCWAPTGPDCRPASGNGWPWPGPSCATPRCCCSTSPPPISTAGPRRACWPPCGG